MSFLTERALTPNVVNAFRFLMNGKALCLMSLTMFTYRVPLGGKTLFKDFQIRLSNAMYVEREYAAAVAAAAKTETRQNPKKRLLLQQPWTLRRLK
jgi:hypothetical protein